MQVQSTALMFHQVSTGHDNMLSVVAHDIHFQEHGAPVIGAGKVLDTEAKERILGVLSEDVRRAPEFIEPMTLLHDTETLVWYRPRQKTLVCLNDERVTIPMPSLVFVLHRGRLYVRAYKGERRPEPTTWLLHAGLPNLYGGGNWCSGGNRLPERPSQRHIGPVEEMFFESPFTHDGMESGRNEHGMDSLSWLKSLQGKPRFPIRQLKATQTTLRDWIRECLR